jgi:hypothetical protein
MKFTVTTFWLNPKSGVVEPHFEGPFMEFPSLEIVRKATRRFVTRDSFPGYCLAIESDDGSVSERWYWHNGEPRLKDA